MNDAAPPPPPPGSDPGPRFPGGSPLWMFPMLVGAMLFGFGILIWVAPQILAIVVGAAFCAIGLSVMGIAWRLRPRPGGRAGGGARRGSYVEFRVEE